MTERLNVSQFDAEELEKVRKGQLAEVVKNHPPQPQQPYGQPQEVPQQRLGENQKKHIRRDGR
jgi:DNA-binding TFAR19-related protein (PDSD5 family)